ncbi:hypothetical protein [Kiloniella sp.]|uniref:hypothetical protein n=1 Tax=Kiloniella sp. TaxID=1938587 RepID=UPI003B027126
MGDTLADGAEFIEDLRLDLIAPLIKLVENTPKSDEALADLLQQFLFVVLGPGGAAVDALGDLDFFTELASLPGLGLLLDDLGNVADAADFSDIDDIIDLVLDLSNSHSIWNFDIGRTYTPDLDFGFDLGFPGLSLEMEGGLGVELAWQMGIGFGISTDDGPFIDISRAEELSVSLDAGFLPGSSLVGSLGFLQFSADAGTEDLDGNNITDNNHITADFAVNLVNGTDITDEHLSFYELGDLNAIIDFDASAELDLALELAFNKDLLPDVISAILPAIVADFEFAWSLDSPDILDAGFNFDVAGGLDLLAFNNVGIDLGSFIGDFLGPVVGKIQEITEPLEPIVEIITAPIPVISDLAGKPVSLVDLASTFGEFDPGFIYALADLISFVNSIPAEPGSVIMPLGDFVVFGSGILSPEDLAAEVFSFAKAINPESLNFDQAISDLFDTLDPLSGLFDEAGNFVQGVFDAALGGDASTPEAGSVGGLFGGDFNSQDRGGFEFPFLNDPKQIFGALLGNPIVLVTYDLPPLIVEFSYEQSFPIYGPLWGAIGAGLGVKVDLAFGYDTLGVQRFAEGGFENPLDLLAGFFISDTNMPDGSGTDVPELQFIGEINVAAELNAGVASAGVQAAIILIVDFDLNDPDGDGRVRVSELVGNFLYELNYGSPVLAPIAIFDVSGEIAFQLRAYLEILTVKMTFNITPQITLFEFSIDFDREPFLATERGDGSLLLNIGPNSESRLHGDTRDIAETINVYQSGSFLYVWSDQFNVSIGAAQKYSGDSIIGFGGEFDDTINIDASVMVAVELEGGTGDDEIHALGSGGGTIKGDEGDDTLSGGDGAEIITGGEGNDTIDGGAGMDLIFGDTGRTSARLTSVLIRDKDGDDVITGGDGDDIIFGGGGTDTIGGDGPLADLQGYATSATITDDLLDPGAGSPGGDTIFGDGGRIVYERDGAPLAEPEIRSTNTPDGKKDYLFGHGGADLIYAGAGDDIVDGGAGDDELYGESGFDTVSGGGDSDTIYGGTEADVLYGFRISTETHGDLPGTDGQDTIEGNEGNDFIRGNEDDDTIYGGRGTDIIFGDENNDTIFAGSDNDYVFGGADNDTVEGGTGNDIVFGDDGLVVFFDFGSLAFAGSFESPGPGHVIDGNHRLIGDVALDGGDPMILDNDDNFRTLDLIVTAVAGTDGDDFVIGGEGDDIVIGGAGDDTVFGDFDPDQVLGGIFTAPIPADEDILIGDAGRIEFKDRLRELISTVVGNIAGDDTLSGNGGEDVLLGGGNAAKADIETVVGDTLYGRMDPAYTDPSLDEEEGISDDDIIVGDDGRVVYDAGVLDEISTTKYPASPDPADTGGADFVEGSIGDDIIFGGFGDDILTGATGEDIIVGDQGVVDYEFFNGGEESAITWIYSYDDDNSYGGADTISGNEDNDVIIGGADGDTVTGDEGQDIVIGDQGEVVYNDVIGSDIFRPNLDFVRTTDFLVGGDDVISGGADKDIVMGGSFADTIRGDNDLANAAVVGANDDVLIGDQGEIEFDDSVDDPNSELPAMVQIETTDVTNADGGIDTIEGNEGIDIILGGVEGDILRGNLGDDIILGDEAILRFDGSAVGAPPSMTGLLVPFFDDNLLSLDLIASKNFALGSDDFIFGNEGNDIAMGGTGADVIIGDNEESAPGEYGVHEANAGQDILIGDQGRVTLYDAVDELQVDAFANNISRVESTDAIEADGDGDYIEGNDFADVIIGGVNNGNEDTLLGEADIPDYVETAGDDIILGDEGLLRFDVLPVEDMEGAGDDDAGLAILDTLDQIITFKTGDLTDEPTHLGGAEVIFGNGGSDIVMGGTDSDTIYGDLYSNAVAGNGLFDDVGLVDSNDPGSDVLIGDGGEMRFIDFEVFKGDINADHVTIIQTVETGEGGADTIEGNEHGDVIMGGFDGDTLFGESNTYLALMVHIDDDSFEAGNDVILGDNGQMNWVLEEDNITNRPDVDDHEDGTLVTLDSDRLTLDRITTIDPTLGGQDRIEGNGASDTIFGGTDSDLIWGDTPDGDPIAAQIDADAEVDGADGADLVFGDHGKLYPTLPTIDDFYLNNNFFSIDTQDADLGRSDVLFGNGNDDIMLGGQGDDLMFGSDGDDDMIGGHNVTEGEDDLDDMDDASKYGLSTEVVALYFADQELADLNPAENKEFNDIMDGGTDDDVMAGDNAIIIRQTDDLSTRFRIVGDGGELYTMDAEVLGGIILVDTGFTANITDDFQMHQDMTLVRTVYLLDHDQDTETDGLANNEDGDPLTNARRFGNDIMVGGLNDDELFGQLGDDIIQGDGQLEVIDPAKGALDDYDPAQDADPSFDIRNQNIDGLDVTLRFSVFEDLMDGNDYIEGNGGNDRIYGGLGQDDIVGGSSTLFTYLLEDGPAPNYMDRPDGADLIYGGTGNTSLLQRNAGFEDGDLDISGGTIVTDDIRHAADADVILGDNGDIFQIVEINSPAIPVEYEYDVEGRDFDTGYSEDLPIRVRAVNLVDYGYSYVDNGDPRETLTFDATARGAGDLIYGESGDDIIHGMTGNDALFGNSEDDDLYGEVGTDFLLGGTGRDGILGDDGLILTSRNSTKPEPLYGIAALEEDEGPLKNNEEPNFNSLNVEISTPGNIQRAIINVENQLQKDAELYAFRTDDVEGTVFAPLFGEALRFNDIVFGGLGQDFLHTGDGDDAVSGAEALPIYYSGEGVGFEGINNFLLEQQMAPTVGGSVTTDNPFWFAFAPSNPGDILRFEGETPEEFALYDEYFPRTKVMIDAAAGSVFEGLNFEFVNADVSAGPDTIEEIGHGLVTGMALLYENTGEADDGGLEHGLTYFVIVEDADHIKLAATQADALSGTKIGIGGFGGGETHSLTLRVDFILNFAEHEGPDGFAFSDGAKPTDGDDRIFGDIGNDWMVGGSGRDHMYGGRGNDLLNMDDDHDSGAKIFKPKPKQTLGDPLENTLSDEYQAYADIAYGGAGRDVLILNTGADRAIDWVGEFNSYIVPFSPFGAFHISRSLQPQLEEYLLELSDSDGADVRSTISLDPAVFGSTPDAQLYVDHKFDDVRTDDPDADRNFEPFGELGMVRQEDRDWQEQTGAPDDPQPGNLQGKREIMRRELFTDDSGGGGGAILSNIAFAADVGEWNSTGGEYHVSPTIKGEEAISIFHLDAQIPGYVEVLVTAWADKDKQGYDSNSYIIFDYQSATDFKFAGINQSLDKIQVGHRTAEGWVIDTQSNMRLRAGQEYDLTLTLHGSIATIYVNGGNATSFVYEDNLNTGLLGLGANNAKAHFDDYQVQKLPPNITYSQLDEFDTTSNYVAQIGSWSLDSGSFVGSSGAGELAIATDALSVEPFARIWLQSSVQTDGLGGFVFDYLDADNFKFVALDAVNDQLVIGHMGKNGLVIDSFTDFNVNENTGHLLAITIQGAGVTVAVDNEDVLGFAFYSLINDGEFGLLNQGGETVFDDALLQTDDPAYIEALTGDFTAASTGTGSGNVTSVTQDDLAAIIDEAAERWVRSWLVTEEQIANALVSSSIVDLPGNVLAQISADGHMTIDVDAAGNGWFIDSSPGDDNEFRRHLDSDARMATPNSPALGQMDLLTAVMHEIGHSLGFDHTAIGNYDLMGTELSNSVRLLPEGSDDLINSQSITSVETKSLEQASEDQIPWDRLHSALGLNSGAETLAFESDSGQFIDLLDEDDEEDVEFVDLLSASEDDAVFPSDNSGVDKADDAALLPNGKLNTLDKNSLSTDLLSVRL